MTLPHSPDVNEEMPERLNYALIARRGDGRIEEIQALPERVVQFGTGAFLRGFADYFIDKANRSGSFAGRIVVVGSTGSGRARQIMAQDGLYTLSVRGRENGQTVDDAVVISSISRAISSRDQWDEVIALARKPELELIISNTTEVGISYDPDDRLDLAPPRSFPGKLTAFLHERARTFDFDHGRGLTILPCELIENNGSELREIVLRLGEEWGLGDAFLRWISGANVFCNTLVDRIVPGRPARDAEEELVKRLGYRDDLLTIAEPYRLWAIEGLGADGAAFPLAAADEGIVLTDDLLPYRERKVRVLNGAHTVTVPAALLLGLETVREAVEDPLMGRFIRRVVFEEIVPSLDIDPEMARSFAEDVLERFANPFIRHNLRDITFQQTMKMRVRVLPSMQSYVRKDGHLPSSLAFGFACFIDYQLREYAQGDPDISDDAAAYWRQIAADADSNNIEDIVKAVASDEDRWGFRLDALPDFTDVVATHVRRIRSHGARAALQMHLEEAEA